MPKFRSPTAIELRAICRGLRLGGHDVEDLLGGIGLGDWRSRSPKDKLPFSALYTLVHRACGISITPQNWRSEIDHLIAWGNGGEIATGHAGNTAVETWRDRSPHDHRDGLPWLALELLDWEIDQVKELAEAVKRAESPEQEHDALRNFRARVRTRFEASRILGEDLKKSAVRPMDLVRSRGQGKGAR